MSEGSSDAIPVVVAVILNEKQEVLIALRRSHQHLAGLWEFPGGKQDIDETPESALVRELKEELAIKPLSMEHLYSERFEYPTKSVLLKFYLVLNFDGIAIGAEGQEIRWCAVSSLRNYQFPEANTRVITALEDRITR